MFYIEGNLDLWNNDFYYILEIGSSILFKVKFELFQESRFYLGQLSGQKREIFVLVDYQGVVYL